MRGPITRAGVVLVTTLALVFGGINAAQAAPQGPSGDDPSILIVGGKNAKAINGEVSIQHSGRHRCTGNLITPEWVLTAGHCIPILVVGETLVRAGSLDWTAGGELVGVSRVVLNPVFTGEVVKGDHALIKLSKRVRARPIPMALNPGKTGTLGRITGWGITCQDPALPECAVAPSKLQELATVVMDPSRCDLGTTPAGVPIFSAATEVCFASADGQPRMACHGDSGGPLKRKFGNKEFLVATTSGDGDDLTSRPNYCSTGPDGGQGMGISEKVGPSFLWIVRTLFGADEAAKRKFVRTTRQ